jgi:carbamoyltransferase
MNILGINAYHGDAAAVLLADGVLVAALEEERFRRIKHVAGVPTRAVGALLEGAHLALDDIDAIAVSRNPKTHLLRKAVFALRYQPHPRFLARRLRNAGRINDLATTLAAEFGADGGALRRRLRWVEHHPAHLASAFFVSPYEEAAVCAIDGFGDFVSTSSARGHGSHMTDIQRTFFPHSLGLVYLAMTQFLGFWSYGDEYKVMGLAPYGLPDYADRVRQLIRLEGGGSFTIDLSYFRHWSEGVAMTWEDGVPQVGPAFTGKLERLLGPARRPDEPVTDRHQALAASVQLVFEEATFHVLNALHRRTRLPRLCIAGGCGMNSVMNGKIRERTPFREVYVQPASADNGTALGAAFHLWHRVLGRPRAFVMDHAYWGPESSDADIAAALAREQAALAGCVVTRIDDEDALCGWAAQRIAAGQIVGWFQGRMEWGARALGNRSILADPRRADMRERINTKIKFREPFRPFAPSILEEALDEYFTGAVNDPFMAQVYPVRKDKREIIPAVTHVDGSGRLQTVSRHTNPRYWKLIKAFEAITGVPVMLNTSFNENEPIVLRPEEGIACFIRTRMDALVVGRYAIARGGSAPRSQERLTP